VKYLRYQLTALQPLWPEMMEPLVEQTDHLGELLGEDHDLAVLAQQLTAAPERFDGEDARELLFALIAHRRKELQDEAMLLGQRLFQDSPSVFARRLKGYWMTWHHLRPQKNAQVSQSEMHP
jgi:CHAD domain-containing protein